MTRHGKFEAVSLLHRSGHTSVWTARPAGSATAVPNHCLKLVELSDHELADRDPTAAEHLLVGAALQQAMADRSPGWAPVYELGSDGTDAFYVTKLYPRSAQSMIDGRARLSSSELRTVMLAVVDALLDLQAGYGRPHADLKPTNVLIGEHLRPGQIVLSDPGAMAENLPSLTRASDPKAVGQLLYALVTHRPHTGARWPLAYNDAWRALGRSGRQWFALCEPLVNPMAAQLPDLDQLHGRIAAVQTSRRRTSRALVAVPIVAAAAVAAYVYRGPLAQGWHAANQKLVAMARSGPARKPGARVGPKLPPATRPTLGGNSRPRIDVLQPAIAVAPTTAPDLSATLAGLTAGPAAPAADPAPRPKPPAVPPKPPASAPTPDAANRRALALVRDWSPPDYRSDAAQQAFEDGRRQFLQSHAATDALVTYNQWEAVSTRLRLAGDAYPPVDVATTAGWPVAVADQVAARREQVLARAVGAAFDQASVDPAAYRKLTDAVRRAVTAATAARKALAGGSLPAARAATSDYRDTLAAVAAADTGVAEAMAAATADLNRLAAVEASTDPSALLSTADDESSALAVRTAAWTRLAAVADPAVWPADFAAAAADHARGVELAGLLHDQMATPAEQNVLAEADRRTAAFVGRLHKQADVAAAADQAADPQYADLVARCPAWFRFDVALSTARRITATNAGPAQRQVLVDRATAADAPAARDVVELLRAGDRRATGTLANSGPAATGRWRLHAGSTRDHCTYDAVAGRATSIEFLRVHMPATDPAAAGLDCYLSATVVPVSLASHLLANDAGAIAAARDLTGSVTSLTWQFADDVARPITINADAYRRRFVLPASDGLPVTGVTPPMAMLLARRAGCRLPSAAEWRAAYDAARRSDDRVVRGFATQGWKLRTVGSYTKLLANPARDPSLSPDAGAFGTGVTVTDAVWSRADLSALGGRAAGDPPTPPDAWPLSTLESADPFGFRPAAGTDAYSGVFHDLVGNVGQLLVDVPATLAEQLDPAKPTVAADIRTWFTPDRVAALSVVGGSAVSPIAVVPTTPQPLPPGTSAYADVGFRLAFTDPTARPAEAWTALRRMAFATAP